MTLKLKMLFEKLPENDYNISKTAKLVGFSESYATSRIYDTVRNCKKLERIYSVEGIKQIQSQALKRFQKEKDNSNTQRAIEHMGIIAGIKRISEVDNKTPERVVIVYDVPHKVLDEMENSAKLPEAIDNKQDI